MMRTRGMGGSPMSFSCCYGDAIRLKKKRHGRAAHATAFTLIELLISMTLTACLMVAVSAAFNASTSAARFNDSYFHCTQSARFALEEMTTEIRRGDAVEVDPSNTLLQIICPAEQRSANEIFRQFAYDAVGRRITLQIFFADGATSPRREVARDVTSCTFGPVTTATDAGGAPVVVCVPIAITCSIGGSTVTLHGAASPRRALRF